MDECWSGRRKEWVIAGESGRVMEWMKERGSDGGRKRMSNGVDKGKSG